MLNFLVAPYIEKQKQNGFIEYLSFLIKSYILCFLFVSASGFIIIAIDPIISNILNIESIHAQVRSSNEDLTNYLGQHSFIMVVFIAPLIEEMIFRLPLNFQKLTASIAIATFLFVISGGSFFRYEFGDFKSLIPISIVVVSLFILPRMLSTERLRYLRRFYFKHIFLASAIIFGLVHLSNIKEIHYEFFPLYPIYVLPQMIIGLFLGMARIQKGFAAAWLLHAMINATSFIF